MLRPVGGHEVLALDGADGDDAVVAAGVAHHADGADRQQHGEDLGGLAVEVVGDEFFQHDLVGVAEHVEPLGRDVADDADREAGAGERVTPDDVLGQAERFADLADLVLEQVAERLDELEAEFLGQAADVVVQLDVGGRAGVAVAGFDHVGVERALGEELRAGDALAPRA